MFSIEFIDNDRPSNDKIYEPNLRITIGRHIEYAEVDTTYWRKKDFERHWLKTISKFINDPRRMSCTLFVSMYPMDQTELLEGWVLYKDENNPKNIFVQNCFIINEEILKYKSQEELLNRDDVRVVETDSGEKVSEWKTTLESISNWAKELEFHSL